MKISIFDKIEINEQFCTAIYRLLLKKCYAQKYKFLFSFCFGLNRLNQRLPAISGIRKEYFDFDSDLIAWHNCSSLIRLIDLTLQTISGQYSINYSTRFDD